MKQDIAQSKKQQVEQELFTKEQNASAKVEANTADVLHGGEFVSSEPANLSDQGSKPVDASHKQTAKPGKTANTEKYVQSSTNPEINKPSVVNLGENEVDHKVSHVNAQEQVVDDVEHGEAKGLSPVNPTVLLGVLGLGGVAGYFAFGTGSKGAKQEKKA